MRIYKSKAFSKFAKGEGISNKRLLQAVNDAEAGLIDADYGGGVIKQRIARPNAGKSGGYRSIILYRRGNKAFFVYGFAKNERSNISNAEVRDFKDLADKLFGMSDNQIALFIKSDKMEEINQ